QERRRGDGHHDPAVVAELVADPRGRGAGPGLVLAGVRAESPGYRRDRRGNRGRAFAAADASRLLRLPVLSLPGRPRPVARSRISALARTSPVPTAAPAAVSVQ